MDPYGGGGERGLVVVGTGLENVIVGFHVTERDLCLLFFG